MRSAILLLALGGARAASADEQEASIHLEIGPAVAWIEDARDQGATASLPGARLSLRATYGLSDAIAVELGLGATLGASTRFDGQTIESGQPATLDMSAHAFRLTSGATARLGVRFIPTVTLHLGYQHRLVPAGIFADPQTGAFLAEAPSRQLDDVIVLAGLGFDYRFNARWIAGISVQAVHAFSLDGNTYDAIEAPAHLSYYWYPRW